MPEEKKTTSPEHSSNPAPDNGVQSQPGQGMYDPKAEKYLREGGNIEDLPDAEEDQDAQEQLDHDGKE